jgi:hypothetical protein
MMPVPRFAGGNLHRFAGNGKGTPFADRQAALPGTRLRVQCR